MTDDKIRQIAARHAAYADGTITLMGDAVVAFARDLLKAEHEDRETRMLARELLMIPRDD